ncbi:MAG: patatin-like phospholipase family protein [Gemmataceae bacterium]
MPRARFTLTLCLLMLAGCLGGHRNPVPPSLAVGVRERVDLSAPPSAYSRVDSETAHRMIAHFAEDEVDPVGPCRDVLVLSGGGMYGAFTAGVLTGWSQSGTRPTFHCVTGVSTGALVATLAFLGPDYDDTLARFAVTVDSHQIYRLRRPVSILWSASVASSEPLEKLIASVVTADLLTAVAKGHAQGRRLYVGTTNLESRRLVVWDMGAIAARGDTQALKLFRTVLLASCAIPGFFAPVPIEVEIDGKQYTELHVDGGASASLFLRLPELPPDQAAEVQRLVAEGHRPLSGSNLYIIVSGKLFADPAPVRLGFVPVAGSSLTSLLYAEARGDLYSLFTGSLVSGIKYHLTALPQEFVVNPDATSFDPVEMRRLYDEGVRIGKSPRPWQPVPPGPDLNEGCIPRAGVKFATPEKIGPPAERR